MPAANSMENQAPSENSGSSSSLPSLRSTIAAEGQHHGHDDQAQHHPQVEPAEVAGDEGQRGVEHRAQRCGREHAPQDDGQNESGRQDELHGFLPVGPAAGTTMAVAAAHRVRRRSGSTGPGCGCGGNGDPMCSTFTCGPSGSGQGLSARVGNAVRRAPARPPRKNSEEHILSPLPAVQAGPMRAAAGGPIGRAQPRTDAHTCTQSRQTRPGRWQTTRQPRRCGAPTRTAS